MVVLLGAPFWDASGSWWHNHGVGSTSVCECHGVDRGVLVGEVEGAMIASLWDLPAMFTVLTGIAAATLCKNHVCGSTICTLVEGVC